MSEIGSVFNPIATVMQPASIDSLIDGIPPGRPVLVAGATASGKSSLALRIAERAGGVIVNADAIQVYANWRILTARPTPEDEARAPHALYGHVPADADYSVGRWLDEVTPLLRGGLRPIIVGGTGLYFRALTEGLAEIPPVPAAIRAESEARLASEGVAALVAELDAATAAGLDLQNPRRVQRAWEVLRATGRGLRAWQEETGPPLLPLSETVPLVLAHPREALAERIAARFDAMLAAGVLDEVRANLPGWDPRLPSAKAIGARELVAHLRGEMDLPTARERVIVATRRYAKRQRTWFRAHMRRWQWIDPALLAR